MPRGPIFFGGWAGTARPRPPTSVLPPWRRPTPSGTSSGSVAELRGDALVIRAVWLRGRAEFRSGWRAWLALALLFGVAGGAATAAAAGARRTETAYPRFVDWANASDVETGGFAGNLDQETVLATIEHLPSVADWAR